MVMNTNVLNGQGNADQLFNRVAARLKEIVGSSYYREEFGTEFPDSDGKILVSKYFYLTISFSDLCIGSDKIEFQEVMDIKQTVYPKGEENNPKAARPSDRRFQFKVILEKQAGTGEITGSKKLTSTTVNVSEEELRFNVQVSFIDDTLALAYLQKGNGWVRLQYAEPIPSIENPTFSFPSGNAIMEQRLECSFLDPKTLEVVRPTFNEYILSRL
jgi:hypothetical protein